MLVGGFLGAGKTTLLTAAARELDRRNIRSALILNDQGEGLVDTGLARVQGLTAGEVTGGCFCCRFSDLVEVAESFRAFAPEVIFAEPAGSCADLAATVIAPLRELYPRRFRLAPYTVLVDPARAAAVEARECDAGIAFLFRKQLEEADLVCATKADLHHGLHLARAARYLSARTGAGVAAWLDEVLSGNLRAGGRVLAIDYEQYARAEASLVWLNLEVRVHSPQAVTPALLAGPFFDSVLEGLTAAGAAIAHLKLIDETGTGYLKAAVCANGEEPVVEGLLDAGPSELHDLRLNLRCTGDAAAIRSVVEAAVSRLPGRQDAFRCDCFRPAPPRPQHRIAAPAPDPGTR